MNAKVEKYVEILKRDHHKIRSGCYKDFEIDIGRKYFKIVAVLSNDQRSVFQFINKNDLRFYASHGWNQKGRLIGKLS